MRHFMVLLGGSAVLALLYTLDLPRPFSWVILLGVYIALGYLQGKFWGERTDRALLSIVAVGALAGIWVTLAHLGNVPSGESKFFWFLIGAFTNMFVYALMPTVLVLYVAAYFGIRIERKLNQSSVGV